MSEKHDDFASAFARATGFSPLPFQVALAESDDLPDFVSAPTGAGKTAAIILAWLWRRATTQDAPRRLVYCLPTRGLVTQTLHSALRWVNALNRTDAVGVHALLGGAVDEAWEARPDRDALLIGTQDQLLSRALNRGYAMSPARWPMHFGWLHSDVWWVLDETQLFGPGLSTAAQLQGLRDRFGTAAPSHTTFMSATNATSAVATVDYRGPARTTLSLTDADRAHPVLARRLTAPKPLRPATWDPKSRPRSLRCCATNTRTAPEPWSCSAPSSEPRSSSAP